MLLLRIILLNIHTCCYSYLSSLGFLNLTVGHNAQQKRHKLLVFVQFIFVCSYMWFKYYRFLFTVNLQHSWLIISSSNISLPMKLVELNQSINQSINQNTSNLFLFINRVGLIAYDWRCMKITFTWPIYVLDQYFLTCWILRLQKKLEKYIYYYFSDSSITTQTLFQYVAFYC
jgi:hypothetical protein